MNTPHIPAARHAHALHAATVNEILRAPAFSPARQPEFDDEGIKQGSRVSLVGYKDEHKLRSDEAAEGSRRSEVGKSTEEITTEQIEQALTAMQYYTNRRAGVLYT